MAIQRIALGQSQGSPQTIYAAFSDGGSIAGIAKTTSGGGMWTKLTVPLATSITQTSNSAGAPAHQHSVTIPAVDLDGVAAAHVYTTTLAGMPAHTHTQPAQPTTLAHYLLAAIEFLARDAARVQSAYGRVNLSPMGAAAITTS